MTSMTCGVRKISLLVTRVPLLCKVVEMSSAKKIFSKVTKL